MSNTPNAAAAVIDQFLAALTPQLEIAGRYALQLQSRLPPSKAPKQGDAWTSVLTDADLGVQAYLEAFVIAQFPDWYFYGEEHEHSSNTRYFDHTAPIAVMLDPINGTRLYRDGADSFDIIISLRIEGRIVATISHMPAQNITYLAAIGRGCWSIAKDKRTTLINSADNRSNAMSIYQADALRHRIPDSVDCYDILADYDLNDPRCCLNAVFNGALGGYLFLDCLLLDIGATAFAVVNAGGIATQPDGTPLDIFDNFEPERKVDFLVCMNRELHAPMTEAFSTADG